MLHLQVAGMRRHPCKRDPLPFISVECSLSVDSSVQRTRKSNGLPPQWPDILTFPLPPTAAGATINLTFLESRLFLLEEPRGQIALPINVLTPDAVLIEWVPLVPARDGIAPMEALILAHLTTMGAPPFDAPRGGYAVDPPWEAPDVTPEDFWRMPPGHRPPEEGNHGISPIVAEFFGRN